MFVEEEFSSEGAILPGRWYTAQNKFKAPCIVMCHGTSATITMGLSDYACEFQAKGFTAQACRKVTQQIVPPLTLTWFVVKPLF